MQIVIVDDTPVNLTLMQALVTREIACTPRVFSDPVEALAYCSTEELDLLIVDYMMPELDGIEFIRRLRTVAGREDLPILMVTADHEKKTRYDALRFGATDFLTKPIDRYEFQPRIRNMLALRQAHLALRDRAATLAAEVHRATADIQQRERDTITRLARAAEFRDPETGAHIQRMAHYSALIARRLGLSAEVTEEILLAAPLHDVGKMGIPDHILLKPGKLTPEEFEIMKGHAGIGYDILRDSSAPVVKRGAIIALTHHEKFDGSGYPHGLAGDAIALEGRIVAVADVFDALTSVRPYKKAWSLEEAQKFLIDGRGAHFDPSTVDAFLAGWEEALAIRDKFGVE